MPRFCHNCGDPVEEGEVFCDKCGTRLSAEDESQNQYVSQEEQQYRNNYSNNMSQQNMRQQNMNQQYFINQQDFNRRIEKKPSAALKFAKIMGMITGVAIMIIVILVVIASFLPDNPTPPPTPIPTPVITPKVNPTPTPIDTNSDKSLVIWTADLNAYSTYVQAEKKINVDYSVLLKNNGTRAATNVKVYLNPVANDENAAYVGIKDKTIVNLDENIASINAGATKDIKTKFYYSNIESDSATQASLQEIANRYVRIPVLVEWQENGKVYTQSLVIQ